MASRLELQTLLEELLGSKNVYYQPPESLKMKYDAIRYSLSTIDIKSADDTNYMKTRCYNVIVISRKPDPEVINKLLDLSNCSIGRFYVAENLYHYTFTLYY